METAPFRALKKAAACLCLLIQFGFLLTDRAIAQSAPALQSPAAAEPTPIQKELPPVGVPTEQAISPNEAHVYKVKLTGGQAFPITFQKKGIYIFPRILDSQKEPLIEAYSQTGLNGKIQMVFIPKDSGEYQLYIQGFGERGLPSAYLMTVEENRTPTPHDWAVFTLCQGRLLSDLKNFEQSVVVLKRAVEQLREVEDTELLGEALYSFGTAQGKTGNIQLEQEFTQEALSMFRKHGIQEGEWTCLIDIAGFHSRQQNYQQALDLLSEVVAHQRKNSMPSRTLGFALSNLGNVYLRLGEPKKSLESFNEASVIFHRFGDGKGVAIMLYRIGYLTLINGDIEASIKILQLSLSMCGVFDLPITKAHNLLSR